MGNHLLKLDVTLVSQLHAPLPSVKRTTLMYKRDKPTKRTPHTRTNTTVILAESLNKPRYRKDSFCTENNDYTGNDLFLAKNS